MSACLQVSYLKTDGLWLKNHDCALVQNWSVMISAASEGHAGNKTAMISTLRSIPQLDSVFMPGGDGGQLVRIAISITLWQSHCVNHILFQDRICWRRSSHRELWELPVINADFLLKHGRLFVQMKGMASCGERHLRCAFLSISFILSAVSQYAIAFPLAFLFGLMCSVEGGASWSAFVFVLCAVLMRYFMLFWCRFDAVLRCFDAVLRCFDAVLMLFWCCCDAILRCCDAVLRCFDAVLRCFDAKTDGTGGDLDLSADAGQRWLGCEFPLIFNV